jgi:diaminopimelate epimerase
MRSGYVDRRRRSLLVGNASAGDARMRIINADGSEAEMCGNGMRCVARYLDEHDGESPGVGRNGGRPDPRRAFSTREPYRVASRWATASSARRTRSPAASRATPVDVGNPHVVIRVDDVAAIDLAVARAAIERDPRYPHGTNVHFVSRHGAGVARAHWERGAGATQACGTGAVAVAAVLIAAARRASPVTLHVPGGVLRGRVDGRQTRDADRRRGARVRTGSGVSGSPTPTRAAASISTAREPLADGGIVRACASDELIPAPPGTVTTMLPGRAPLLAGRRVADAAHALARCCRRATRGCCCRPIGRRPDAPALPLFGYTFACVVDDELHVAAMRTDESEDWTPRAFAAGELEALLARASDRSAQPHARASRAVLARIRLLHRAERLSRARRSGAAGLARVQRACVGCISELDPTPGCPRRRRGRLRAAGRRTRAHRAPSPRARPDGIVSFGQGCEGEPLLRVTTIARAIERDPRRAERHDQPQHERFAAEERCAADRRRAASGAHQPQLVPARDVYAAYYRPVGLRSRRRARSRSRWRSSAGCAFRSTISPIRASPTIAPRSKRWSVPTRASGRDGADAHAQHRSRALLRARRPAREPLGMRDALAAHRTPRRHARQLHAHALVAGVAASQTRAVAGPPTAPAAAGGSGLRATAGRTAAAAAAVCDPADELAEQADERLQHAPQRLRPSGRARSRGSAAALVPPARADAVARLRRGNAETRAGRGTAPRWRLIGSAEPRPLRLDHRVVSGRWCLLHPITTRGSVR